MPWTQFDNTGLPSDIVLLHPAVASSRHPVTGVWTLWSIGGTYAPAVAYTTTDGTSWQPFADALGWPARRDCGAAWLQSQGLLVIGGDGAGPIYGDAWIWMGDGPFRNADELYRTMYHDSGAPVQSWGPRKGMCLVTFKDRWFVFGGDKNSTTVFSSDSWVVWQQLTKNKPTDPDPWRERQYAAACVFRDRIFMLGGSPDGSDVYSTDDGITWRKAATAPWSRGHANAVVVNGVMYLLGGSGDDGKVWKTSDGDAWEALPETAPWYTAGVGGVSAGVLNDKIYVWGGPRRTDQGAFGNTAVWCYTPSS